MRAKGSNSVDRRDFLGALMATGAVGLAGLAPFRLNAMQDEGAGKMTTPGFEDWLNRIKGKHRQVFDSPHNVGGMPFAWVRVYMMTNQMVGAKEEDTQAVLVLRHDAIPLAMESSLWKKYNFSKVFHVVDEQTKKPIKENVFWQPKQGALPLPGMGINELMSSGVLIGLCEMAITVYSTAVAQQMKLKPEEVKKEWIAGVLPGIQLVPSGVLAINRAQERGCSYCFAG